MCDVILKQECIADWWHQSNSAHTHASYTTHTLMRECRAMYIKKNLSLCMSPFHDSTLMRYEYLRVYNDRSLLCGHLCVVYII